MDKNRRRRGHGLNHGQGQPAQPNVFQHMGLTLDTSFELPDAGWPSSSQNPFLFTTFHGHSTGLASSQQYPQQYPQQFNTYFNQENFADAVPPPRPPDQTLSYPLDPDIFRDFEGLGTQPDGSGYPPSLVGAEQQSPFQYPSPPTHGPAQSEIEANPQSKPNAEPWNPVATRGSERGNYEVSPNDAHMPAAIYSGSTVTTQPGQPSHLAPSNWDGVSRSSRTRSDNRSETSDFFVCKACTALTGNLKRIGQRSRKRHMIECHNGVEIMYTCTCMKQTKRCSNHKRHVEKCDKRASQSCPYICFCGLESSDISVHLHHIRRCGKERPGRRPGPKPDISNNNAGGL